jgi:hypothetical protein
MKLFKSKPVVPTSPLPTAKLDRRGLVLGVGVAGAAAIAAQTLRQTSPEPIAGAAAKAQPDQGDGYRLTQHVLRYYETTKV